MRSLNVLRALAGALLLFAGLICLAQPVTVQSTANPQYAGQATTPSANAGTVPPCTAIPAGTATVTFTATGTVNASVGNPNPIYQFYGPDGTNTYGPVNIGPVNGISGIVSTSQRLFLVGAFLDAAVPSGAAPPALTFTGNPSFPALAPALRQLFFVGDGLTGTGSGAAQVFTVPAGATRVCFGVEDSSNPGSSLPMDGYSDNGGSFTVTSTFLPAAAATPPGAVPMLSPLALLLVAAGLAAAGAGRLRKP